MRRLLVFTFLACLAAAPASAQSVILSQYPPGRVAAASSLSMTLSTEDKAVLDAINTNTSTTASNTGTIATNTSNSATSLNVIDDWDESDRAKVNLIVGQAGVAAGAGAVGATVLRMTLASDDPAVASLSVLDDWDESDRAKVNLIVGQAGVAAGAGAVSATTLRMTLASDDPAVSVLGATSDAAASAGSTGSISAKLRLTTSLLDTINTSLGTLAGVVSSGGINVSLLGGVAPTPDVPLDMNTTATVQNVSSVAIALPSASGAVIGGTITNPLRVYATDGTNSMPTMDAVGRAGFLKLTDGTNTMPTMDAVGRAGFVKVTDGTNTQPTGDAAARAIHVNLDYAGTAAVTGNGTASGSLRVSIASDNSAVAGMGVGAMLSAPPANANYIGGIGGGLTGGLMVPIPVCDQQAFLNMTTATTTELVPLTSGQTVHICHIRANANGTTTMTFKKGTSTNCSVGTAAIDADYNLTAQVGFTAGGGVGEVLSGETGSNAVCVTNSSAVNLQVFVKYGKW